MTNESSSFSERKLEQEKFALCGNYVATKEDMEKNLLIFLQSEQNEDSRQANNNEISISLISKETAKIDDDKKCTRSANVESFSDIDFYLYSIKNGINEGFAITCPDRRIGNILAVIDNGVFDPEDDFMQLFGSCLNDYVENTIDIWNEITDENLKITYARLADEDWKPQYCTYSNISVYNHEENTNCILKTEWGQREIIEGDTGPYNDAIQYVFGKDYLAGCTTVAMAQVLAYHYSKTKGKKTNVDVTCWNNVKDWGELKKAGWTDKKYDWNEITNNKSIDSLSDLGKVQLQTFIYEISQKIGVNYDTESTLATLKSLRKALGKNNFSSDEISDYTYDKVKQSIDNGYPVIISAMAKKTIKKKFLWFNVTKKVGHAWVIDGWSRLNFTATNDKTNNKMYFYGYFFAL